MNSERTFHRKFSECEYSSLRFDRVLNHRWERQSISQRFWNETRAIAIRGNVNGYAISQKGHNSWTFSARNIFNVIAP